MSVNGLLSREVHMPPEDEAVQRDAYTAGQLAVFGSQRLDHANVAAASYEAAEELAAGLEQLCTEVQSGLRFGIGYRTLQNEKGKLDLMWNPAGTIGGFDARPGWDDAMARIEGLQEGRVWTTPSGMLMPRPYHWREGMFVDRQSGLAMVRRTLWPLRGSAGARSAVKRATTGELQEAIAAISPFLKGDNGASEGAADLPRYLEIGYGLDPAAIRGRRSFKTKMSVNVDKAEGAYDNALGAYPDAVRAQARCYAREAATRRVGEHIFFLLGDAAQLPFADGSMREVFMSNVLNAPIAPQTTERILHEARRVVAMAGNLVLRVNWHQDVWPQSRMIARVERNGFGVVRTVDASEPAYRTLETQYGSPREVKAPPGYYLVACATPPTL